MKSIAKEKAIVIQEKTFFIEIYTDFEVRFRSGHNGLDELGYERNGYERRKTNAPLAIRLFRQISLFLEAYLLEQRPPYLYFTSGFDSSRESLYRILALKLAALGYIYTPDEQRPHLFYCYKIKR